MNPDEEPQGVDFHCHVDLYPDPTEVIAACERERIITLAVTTVPKAWPQNREWTANSAYVHSALGLHPEIVGTRYEEYARLKRLFEETTLIGEVGLDGSPQYRSSWKQQGQVFKTSLERAQSLGGRVLSIHSRRAAKEVIDLIDEQTTPERVLCVLHWFSGTRAAAKKAIEAGCWFSINSQMTDTKQGSELIEMLPMDRILTETDGPFRKEGSRPSEPTDVIKAASEIAKVRGVASEEMTAIVIGNAAEALSFAGRNLRPGKGDV